MKKTTINERIIEVAFTLKGEKELKNNFGFQNKFLEVMMKIIGWEINYQWCALGSELIWKLAYLYDKNLKVYELIDTLFSASSVSTFYNFKNSNKFVISKKPIIGSLVIWRKYENGIEKWNGHAGIVVKINENSFETIEGNSNEQGGREGIEFANLTRQYNFEETNGLRLLGFIYPL